MIDNKDQAKILMLYIFIGFRIMENGSMSLYTLFLMSGGMTVPYVWGVLFLNEELTILRTLGLLSIITAIIISNSGKGFTYQLEGSRKRLSIVNLSTGLKTFSIIKTLLLNGALETNGTLILDEPEIHLHPTWQLVYAEIIVLLQKEFDLSVVITTHSNFFFDSYTDS